MNIDDRLRTAGNALKEGSAVQVDAALGLREIILHRPRPPAGSLPDPPQEPAGTAVTPTRAPVLQLLRRPQNLALAVNLLLVVALGILLVRVATYQPDAPRTAPATVTTMVAATVPPTPPKVRTTVPDACVDTIDLGDEVISRLTRNVRDQRLFLALRDYTIASQACRRQASP
jgi:hypothetical protein